MIKAKESIKQVSEAETHLVGEKDVAETKDLGKYDFDKLTLISGRGSGREGALSITNSRTGQRITISRMILEYLGNPERVRVSCGDGIIVIESGEPDVKGNCLVKYNELKGIVYSKMLVTEITKYHKLDFSNKTSITFQDVDYTHNKDVPVAVIKVD